MSSARKPRLESLRRKRYNSFQRNRYEAISKMHLTPDGPADGGIAGLSKCTAHPACGGTALSNRPAPCPQA